MGDLALLGLRFLDRLKKEDEERTHPSPDHNENIQV
jgi:hypothetical protein